MNLAKNSPKSQPKSKPSKNPTRHNLAGFYLDNKKYLKNFLTNYNPRSIIRISTTQQGDEMASSREVIKLIKADGWYRVKSNGGSHQQFKHPTKKGRVTVPHPKKRFATTHH